MYSNTIIQLHVLNCDMAEKKKDEEIKNKKKLRNKQKRKDGKTKT